MEQALGTDPGSGGRLSTLYACLRPAGHSVASGQRAAAGAEYPGNVATSDLSITGTLVSDVFTSGLASQPTSPGTASSPLMLQAVGFDTSSLKEGAIETLDRGDLGPSSHFTGLTLQWINAGQPESVVLTNAS